jgi:hypothetical protein
MPGARGSNYIGIKKQALLKVFLLISNLVTEENIQRAGGTMDFSFLLNSEDNKGD